VQAALIGVAQSYPRQSASASPSGGESGKHILHGKKCQHQLHDPGEDRYSKGTDQVHYSFGFLQKQIGDCENQGCQSQ